MPSRYSELAPSDRLRPWIAAYWCFEVEPGPQPVEHVIPPDGAISLVVPRGVPTFGLNGPFREPHTILLPAGAVVHGARFWPGAASSLLAVDPPSLRDRSLPPGSVDLGGWVAELARQVAESHDALAAQAAWEQGLAVRVPSARPFDEPVMRAVFALLARRGQLPVTKLAELAGLSPRQLHRRFVAQVGLAPKELARLRRARASIADAVLQPEEAWAAIAAEHGFSDQAHLVREYRRLLGRTPAEAVAYLRTIEHGAVVDR